MRRKPTDRRLTPARADLAAAHLVGIVEAPRYVEARVMQVCETVVNVAPAPDPTRGIDTQAIFGERVFVYDEEEGWAWGQLERDDYVGYLPRAALRAPMRAATHRVDAMRTFLYPGPSIKLPPVMPLLLGSPVHVLDVRGDFAITAEGAIFATHLAPLGQVAADYVATAERFLGVPYLWGGRTSQGTDCSGLVQTAMRLAGRPAPRDSDMLEAWAGEPLPIDDRLAHLRRGDLVFWKGHVGLMQDRERLLHANGTHMLVVSEPLAEARQRIREKTFGPITSIRRPA